MKDFKRKIEVKLGNDNSKREEFFKLVLTGFFLLLGFRMTFLQIFDGEHWAGLAEKNRFKVKTISAPRGKIYDKYGKLIVTNGSGYRLVYLNERDLDPKKIAEISKITGYDEKTVEKRIKNGEIFPYTRENVIFENLNEEKAYKLMERIIDYPYLQVQTYYKRRYLYDTVASHSIGYVKKISEKEYEELMDKGYSPRDNVGKDGLEKFYNDELKGEKGHEFIEVNALSKIQKRGEEGKAPIPGKDLYLSLDIELQVYMEEQFKKDHRSGAFIALDPKTGEILTIVSYPTYSLNMFSSQILEDAWDKIINDPQKPLSNKSIAGEYPPGSIFKVISAMSFLKSGIDPNKKYLDSNGIYTIGKWSWKAWKAGGHGWVDMKKSLVESANPYYYRLADTIGFNPIEETALDFGLNEKTGIDVPGERKGIIPSKEWKKKVHKQPWVPGDTIISAIGQGYVTVTPIQMAMVYSALANKGIVVTPHVGQRLESFDGKEVKLIQGEKKQIDTSRYPTKFYDIIDDALIATVAQNNGTTKTLRTPGIKVAAKSGSAQNPHSKITHAWVAGFFPADSPDIVFTCILEGAGGGGSVAGGMTKRFIDKYLELKYKREHPEEEIPEILDENGEPITVPNTEATPNTTDATTSETAETTEENKQKKTPTRVKPKAPEPEPLPEADPDDTVPIEGMSSEEAQAETERQAEKRAAQSKPVAPAPIEKPVEENTKPKQNDNFNTDVNPGDNTVEEKPKKETLKSRLDKIRKKSHTFTERDFGGGNN